MLKVWISANFPDPDKGDGGIRRVVDAMIKHLPNYGVMVVDRPEEADVWNIHAVDEPPHHSLE